MPEKLKSILFINNKPIIQLRFTEHDEETSEYLARGYFNYNNQSVNIINCLIGTEEELIANVKLTATTYKTGLKGWATRERIKFKNRTYHVRANVVLIPGKDAGLTIGIRLPNEINDIPAVPKSWLSTMEAIS